jgi:hypothetical protein
LTVDFDFDFLTRIGTFSPIKADIRIEPKRWRAE